MATHQLLMPAPAPARPPQAILSCSSSGNSRSSELQYMSHELRQLHSQFIRFGLSSDNDAMGRVIKLCSLSPTTDKNLNYALRVFEGLPHPDAFIYNTIIRGYLHCRLPTSSVLFYVQMLHQSVAPNKFTFPPLIRACSSLHQGRQLHSHVLKFGFGDDGFSQNNLIHMYLSFRSLDEARRVFDKMRWRDAVSYTTLITGYSQCGLVDHAFQVFETMPDSQRGSVSWNAMIAACVQNGRFREAFVLFSRMTRVMRSSGEKVVLDRFGAASMLSACTGLGALKQGRCIHRYMEEYGIEMDYKLVSTLIDMYCKCGCLEKAFEVFNSSPPPKDISLWNCMIGGLAMHGKGCGAIELFKEMERQMVAPDSITFVNLLNACSHSGLVEEGRHLFRHMTETHGIQPEMEHFGCMVDLLGRAGLLGEARKLVDEMTEAPNAGVLGALLGACNIHGNTTLGEQIGERVIELEPLNSGRYVLLSNIYAKAGRWKDFANVRKLMNDRGVKKVRGVSAIELDGVVHEFIAGGRAHPQSEEIYTKMDEIRERIRCSGNTPDIDIDGVAAADADKDKREGLLQYHGEKLAVAFGLLKTKPGETLRVIKNLRVCGDCHRVCKLISEVFDREIIVRDRSRFHHFKGGECSCNDFW